MFVSKIAPSVLSSFLHLVLQYDLFFLSLLFSAKYPINIFQTLSDFPSVELAGIVFPYILIFFFKVFILFFYSASFVYQNFLHLLYLIFPSSHLTLRKKNHNGFHFLRSL